MLSSICYQSFTTIKEGRKKIFYLMMHSTHFIYGYMASDIWLRTIVWKETRCCHIGYSFRLAARVLLYTPSHRQDSTYHSLCYTSQGALAGTRNSSMGPPHEGSMRRPITRWANALTTELHLASTTITVEPLKILVMFVKTKRHSLRAWWTKHWDDRKSNTHIVINGSCCRPMFTQNTLSNKSDHHRKISQMFFNWNGWLSIMYYTDVNTF